jgi:hypothetical protein
LLLLRTTVVGLLLMLLPAEVETLRVVLRLSVPLICLRVVLRLMLGRAALLLGKVTPDPVLAGHVE